MCTTGLLDAAMVYYKLTGFRQETWPSVLETCSYHGGRTTLLKALTFVVSVGCWQFGHSLSHNFLPISPSLPPPFFSVCDPLSLPSPSVCVCFQMYLLYGLSHSLMFHINPLCPYSNLVACTKILFEHVYSLRGHDLGKHCSTQDT